MASYGIGYIAVAAVLCTGLVTCSVSNKPSDAMVQAAAANCTSSGQTVSVRITSSGTNIECVQPTK